MLPILTDPTVHLIHIDRFVTVDIRERDLVERFADRVVKSMNERRRKQSDDNKVRKDQVVGKLMEFAAADWFRENDIECSVPDLKIYKKGKKSFDPDLILTESGTRIHCKSTHHDSRFPCSWLFQLKNAYGYGGDKEFFVSEQDDLVITGIVEASKGAVQLEWLARKNYVRDFMEDPVLSRYVGQMRVLYDSTLSRLYQLEKEKTDLQKRSSRSNTVTV